MTLPLLVADKDRPREGGVDRPTVEVAVGVLLRAGGEFLLLSLIHISEPTRPY